MASASSSNGSGVLNIGVLGMPTFETILRSEQKIAQRDEARRLAVNFAKLPELLRQL